MTIVVDTREKFINKIKDMMVDHPEWPEIRFSCLPLGDYLLTNDDAELLIERKSISDFCGSYHELKPRLHKMRMVCDNTALLLENTYTVRNDYIWLWENNELVSRMKYGNFSNFIAHQARAGTMMFYSMNFEESMQRIMALYDYLPRFAAPRTTLKCGSPAELLLQVPGIGPGNIKKLRDKYNSPLDALNGLTGKSRESLEKW